MVIKLSSSIQYSAIIIQNHVKKELNMGLVLFQNNFKPMFRSIKLSADIR